jgi:phytoene synthase
MHYRADMRHCRRLLRDGSRSFYAASLLLPAYYRAPATALYAFCRVADDLVDNGQFEDSVLAALQERLARIYTGRPENNPVDRSLALVVERFAIPQALLEALLEGFTWDVASRRYESESDVYAYSARVAGTVGVMMAMLMGARDRDVLARACDLGVAMQLTNIARDVGEDARNGRLYLPATWMREHSLCPDGFLASPQFDERVAAVVQRLLDAAEKLYDRSADGISCLPASCRPGMFAARSIYREIGRELQQRGLDSISQRTVVGSQRKLQLLAQACRESLRAPGLSACPPLEETRFLIDSVA